MRFWILLMLLCCSVVSGAERRPNFVIILVDDMGHAGVGCFGNPWFKTPGIEAVIHHDDPSTANQP